MENKLVIPFSESQLLSSVKQYHPSTWDREDTSPDTRFYSQPRMVTHIDDAAIDRLKRYYGAAITAALERAASENPPRTKVRVLDVCSSWISHLPHDLVPSESVEVIAIGMNAEELATNPQLSAYHVIDLNLPATSPHLFHPLGDNSFDLVINSVSVDYLIHPFEVFLETLRVLRPDGAAINTFSNRFFPSKVIQFWLRAPEPERCRLVASYFHTVSEDDSFGEARGGAKFGGIEVFDISPKPGWSDPLWAVQAVKVVPLEGGGRSEL